MRNIHNDGHDSKPGVLLQPNIGLESEVRYSVVDLLNVALADEAVLATKTRNTCWNLRGANYLELHTLLAGQYQLLTNISDEIAERTRMLGGFAIGSLTEFLSHSRLNEKPDDIPSILLLLADHEAAVRFLREDVRKCAEEYEDEGTYILLVSVMRLHEKLGWVLRSYMDYEPIRGEKRERKS